MAKKKKEDKVEKEVKVVDEVTIEETAEVVEEVIVEETAEVVEEPKVKEVKSGDKTIASLNQKKVVYTDGTSEKVTSRKHHAELRSKR